VPPPPHRPTSKASTAAIGRGAYAKGVQRAGAARYTAGATSKGPGRFAEGVQVAQQDYATAVAPYLQAIAATDLPPRGLPATQATTRAWRRFGNALRSSRSSR